MSRFAERLRVPPGIYLRVEQEEDLPLLHQLYAAARDREMVALSHWSEKEKSEFLAMQFAAQRAHYLEHYPDADYLIIEYKGCAIGRLYLGTFPNEIRLMDIALLPTSLNQGIGGALCKALLELARAERALVSLHVESDNPARRLYERLGFSAVGTVSFYELMHWVPPGLEAHSRALIAQLNTAS